MKRTAVFCFLTAALAAQTAPRVQNARSETRPVTGSLDATFRAILNSTPDAAWVGYAAPVIPGDRNSCCWQTINGISSVGCSLEPRIVGANAVVFPPDPNG